MFRSMGHIRTYASRKFCDAHNRLHTNRYKEAGFFDIHGEGMLDSDALWTSRDSSRVRYLSSMDPPGVNYGSATQCEPALSVGER